MLGFVLLANQAFIIERLVLGITPELLAHSLVHALSALLSAEINIDFSYSLFVRPAHNPVFVLHLDSPDVGAEVLTSAGFKVLMQEDLSR